MNHREFSRKEQSFITWCLRAGVDATQRQASKWRNKKGRAYKTMKGILPQVDLEAKNA